MKANRNKEIYQEALDTLRHAVIDEQADGYHDPREVKDFYHNECRLLQEVIDAYPWPNSDAYAHFRLYSHSTLQSFRKSELIDYAHTLEHNWKCSDQQNERMMQINRRLSEENDALQEALDKIAQRQAKNGFCHGAVKSGAHCLQKESCARCWKMWAQGAFDKNKQDPS